jgi:hypothetical protein
MVCLLLGKDRAIDPVVVGVQLLQSDIAAKLSR